mgnify:FL=1
MLSKNVVTYEIRCGLLTEKAPLPLLRECFRMCWGMNPLLPKANPYRTASHTAMYLTRKLKLGQTDQLDALARRAGDLWSPVAKWHGRFVRRHGYWLSRGQAQKMYCKGFDGLHSPSAQAVAGSFYDSLKSWRKKRKRGNYEGLRPPYKQKRYFKTQWKSSAIRLRDDGVLRLSNGRGTVPVLIGRPSGQESKRVEIGWDGNRYELRCQHEVEETDEPAGSSLRVAGEGPVRSVMAHRTGVRYKPHMSCNPLGGSRPGDLVSPMIASKTSCGGDPSCEAATLKRERAAQSGSRNPVL